MRDEGHRWSGRVRGRVGRIVVSVGYRLLFLAVLVGLWSVGAAVSGGSLLPGPVETARAAVDILTDGSFLYHTGHTLRRVLIPFAAAMVVGLAVGLGMGTSRRFEQFADAGVVLGLTIPGLAWAIVAIMLLGLRPLTAYAAVFVTILPVFTITFWQGVKDLDADLLRMGRVFGLSRYRLARHVILPQLVPHALSAGRFGLGLSWKVVVIVEFLGFGNGIGYRLGVAYNLFDMADALAWIGLFTLVMLAVEYGVFKVLERRLLEWRPTVSLDRPEATQP